MFSEHLVMVEQVLHYMHGYITSKRKKEEWTKKIKIISANTLFFFQKKKEKKRIVDVTICRLWFSDMKESISWHAM